MSALTPVYTVGDQIAEAIEVHQPHTGKKAARQRAVELLELVGITQPDAGRAPFRTSCPGANASVSSSRSRSRTIQIC